MNNVYGQRDLYAPSSDMCYDNKGMVTAAQSERPTSQPVRVNITDTDKTHSQVSNIRCRSRIRVPYLINAFLAISVTSLLIISELGYIQGKKLGFTCNDPLISHKFNGDTISSAVLIAGSFLLPLVVLLITEILGKQTVKKLHGAELWSIYKECLVGVMLVLSITQVAKLIIGEHRPHFLDVCEPDANRNCVNGSFVQDYTCTTKRFKGYFLVDTSRSFPSAHSSVSVFIGLFSAYIIQTRLPTERTGVLMKPFLILLCLTWSLVCSLTRITDRRHHWWDVLAGMLLGAAGAFYTLKLLHRKYNDVETPPRISTSTTTLLDVKNKDAASIII